ncbi:MAG: alanine/glycine:cation symporter family protein [Lachnospiraceae bacterium]|jgi:AGCS family alanine or glycine:cation symporter|nr:alanine/glycine:cation symporter family protein [Lachnospiraceae bacterium]MDY2759380.1 alanine/glycine:cation symporter family protein [Lachnospiraceae bacterium]
MTQFLSTIDTYLYFPVLVIILASAGIYFTIRTRGVQLRMYGEAWRVLWEKPKEDGAVSPFQALMVSTASRVGTGNIIGVSTAICLGGPGAMFWMWLLAILGSASAFVETVLAQIYKKREPDGVGCYGGPEHYIETALKNRPLAIIFTVFLILTYGFGFNLLCSYNLQSSFEVYDFYHGTVTPVIVGAILAVIVLICILGGGKRIVRLTEVIVPFMGIIYIGVAVLICIVNFRHIPGMFAMIFKDAFNFRAIGSGITGSCMIYGIKRGLYSNEAGVGSAPHAAASADTTHPVKQGLAAVISVSIDTLFLCTATGLLCLVTNAKRSAETAGAPYVQQALSSLLKGFGPTFLTIAMVLFAFTTLIGNLYYVDNGLKYLHHNKMPGRRFMTVFRIICAVVIFVGALIPMDAAWALADITMGGMAIINIPCCVILAGTVCKALRDYEKQKKTGIDPVFHAKDIGMDTSKLDYWK